MRSLLIRLHSSLRACTVPTMTVILSACVGVWLWHVATVGFANHLAHSVTAHPTEAYVTIYTGFDDVPRTVSDADFHRPESYSSFARRAGGPWGFWTGVFQLPSGLDMSVLTVMSYSSLLFILCSYLPPVLLLTFGSPCRIDIVSTAPHNRDAPRRSLLNSAAFVAVALITCLLAWHSSFPPRAIGRTVFQMYAKMPAACAFTGAFVGLVWAVGQLLFRRGALRLRRHDVSPPDSSESRCPGCGYPFVSPLQPSVACSECGVTWLVDGAISEAARVRLWKLATQRTIIFVGAFLSVLLMLQAALWVRHRPSHTIDILKDRLLLMPDYSLGVPLPASTTAP